MALQRRGVTLERCYDNSYTLSNSDDGRMVVGYIIHSLVSTRSSLSLRSMLGWFFTSGHHWYSISRLRRMKREMNTELNKMASNAPVIHKNDPSELWYIIDSCLDEVSQIYSTELKCLLQETKEQGGDIFRAVATLVPIT